jgi:flagellar biosynthesis anti-sigma factor FlgM
MASSIQSLNGALPDQQIDLVGASKISGNQVAASATEAAPTPAPAQAAADGTDLSALSATLANAIASASAKSPIRPPVIAQIKAQIAAGMYGPDLSSVAEAIVRALSLA